MPKDRVKLVILGALLFCAPAFGSSGAPFVYVSGGQSARVYKATVSTSPTVAAWLLTDANHHPEGMVQGPDKFIYVCEPEDGHIIRFDPNAEGPTAELVFSYEGSGPEEPQCGQFTSDGALLVSDELAAWGVWEFPGMAGSTNPTSITPINILTGTQLGSTFTGAGLTQLKDGTLVIVDQADNKIFLSPFSPTAPHFSNVTAITLPAGTLDTPTGVARSSAGDIFVSNGGALNNIVRLIRSSNGTYTAASSACATFSGTRPMFMGFSADDTLYVAAKTTSESLTEYPGKVFSITVTSGACGTATLVATLPRFNSDAGEEGSEETLNSDDEFAQAIGIAVPPTSDSITVAAFSGTKTFNFGFSAFQVQVGTCPAGATVTETQTFPADIPSLGTISDAPATPFFGEGGLINVYHVSETTPCTPPAGGSFNYLVGAFADSTNPRIVRCTGGICTVIVLTGAYPNGSLIPGDSVTGGKGPGFSSFYETNVPLSTTPGVAGKFCGFGFPLNLTTPPEFDPNDFLLASFTLKAGTSCSGNAIKNAQALLSVAQVLDKDGNPTFVTKTVVNLFDRDEPTLFQFFGGHYFFLLHLQGYAPGTYELSVTFLTGNTGTQSTTFVVEKENGKE